MKTRKELEDIIYDSVNNLIDENIVESNDAELRDLGMKSLQFVQLIINLEEKLEIEFPDEYLYMGKLNKISDFIQCCEELMGA